MEARPCIGYPHRSTRLLGTSRPIFESCSRVGKSSRFGSDRVRVTRPDPTRDILKPSCPDQTREILKTS